MCRPSFSNPSRAVGPICPPRKARKRGGTARHPGLYQDNIPVLVARDRKGATFDAVLPQVTSAAISAALAGTCHAGQSPRQRRRPADRRLRPPRRHSLPRRALAGQANSRGAPPPHEQCQRLPQPPLSSGSTASTASPPKTCQATSAGAEPSKLGVNPSTRQNGSSAPWETDHTNR